MSSELQGPQSDEWAFLDRESGDEPVCESVPQEHVGGELHGLYEGMPYEEYAKIPAYNASRIVAMRRSPMAYKYKLDNPAPETDLQRLGTLTHRMILEPQLIGELAVWGVLEEQKVRRGKVWDAFQAANSHKTILTVGEYERVTGMSASALNNAPIRKYAYMAGPTEVSMLWRHPRLGMRCKARIDKVIPEAKTLVDLKTTYNSEPWSFGATAARFSYVHKMAHYWDGWRTLFAEEPAIKLLAIESKLPCEGVVYDVPRELLLMALEELDNLMREIQECEKSDTWPARHGDELTLELPKYAFPMDEDTELALEM